MLAGICICERAPVGLFSGRCLNYSKSRLVQPRPVLSHQLVMICTALAADHNSCWTVF